MKGIRRAAFLAGVLVMAISACVPSVACDLTIFPADGPDLDEIPAGAPAIVTAADIDPLGWRVIPDDGSGLGDQVGFRLRPEATERFAAFTRDNVGEYLAITVEGRVVSVPRIEGPLDDGDIVIAGPRGGGWIEGFRSCLPVELLPRS